MPSDSTIIGAATIWNYKFIDGSQIGKGNSGVSTSHLTSTIYPIYEVDQLDLAPGISMFRLFTLEVGELDLAPEITSVSVRDVVIIHDQPQEDALDVEPGITFVTIDTVLIVHDQLNEDILDIAPSVISATVTLEVIVHNQLNEDVMDLAPGVTSVYFGVPL